MRAALLIMSVSMALGLASCSDDTTAGDQSGNSGGLVGSPAGGSSTGGAAAGTGGIVAGAAGVSGRSTGGTASSTATPKLDACRAYVQAMCERWIECKFDYPDCNAIYSGDCPDILFSDGSTRTSESLTACAAQWSSFSCDQINRGLAVPCVTPGTRTTGQACVYSSQCASGYCTSELDQCGTCAARIPAGGLCNNMDRSSVCEPGYSCPSTTCTISPGTPPALFFLGDTCTTFCGDGSKCFLDSMGVMRCAAAPTLGQTCGKTKFGQTICAEGLVCNAATNACATGPAVGQPCVSDQASNLCGTDALCDSGTGPGTCVAKGGPGAACVNGVYCLSGLRCECEGGGTCTSQVCTTVVPAGAPCGQAHARCEEGTQCESGVCTPSDAVTKFPSLCPGQ